MNRRLFVKNAALAASAMMVPGRSVSRDRSIRLTILHSNDMHSRIEPMPDDGRRYAGLGGMAQRAAIIKKIRATEENVLLLDAGDIFQGTPYFNFFGGELEFKLMSEMKYDAATIGNHDFDNGIDGLYKMLPHANFPFLCANYDFSGNILHNRFQPYKIFQKDQLNIGVFGLGIELKGLVNDHLSGGTRYLDPIAIAKEMVLELEKKNCHLIICLSHLGYKYSRGKVSDHTLAEQVSGIDLIIGGHTHTFLEMPTLYKNREGHETIINQVGWAGIRLGRIDYVFNRKRSKSVEISSPILIH
ncbi:metallophosphatase [Fulvivirgaceae bacterium BMA12]|uniref:Metallophosphatase n=1 Tax=Agaribacillus aureus TaxID=3051825 RepID=A0ABT8L7U0_9BACT|nr:metallophosphatase [Fulvivirgaceae bacterium BMA12]